VCEKKSFNLLILFPKILVTLEVGVGRTFQGNDMEEHRDRSKLLHDMAYLLDLDVDWRDKIDDRNPHEFGIINVNIDIKDSVRSMADVLKTLINRKKISHVEIKAPNGVSLVVDGATPDQINQFIQGLGLAN